MRQIFTYKTLGQHDFEGKNYDPNLSVKEIAAILRKELKKRYPDIKFSIRKDGYNALNADIKELPFIPFSKEYLAYQKESSPGYVEPFRGTMFNEDYKKIEKDINSLIQSYNFDNSDPMTDYFHVNFYGGRIELDYLHEKELLEQAKTAKESDFKYHPTDHPTNHPTNAGAGESKANGNATVTHNTDKNGIEVKFAEKPESEIIAWLKEHKFRWSKRQKIWYRKFDTLTYDKVKARLKVKEEPKVKEEKSESQTAKAAHENKQGYIEPIYMGASSTITKALNDKRFAAIVRKEVNPQTELQVGVNVYYVSKPTASSMRRMATMFATQFPKEVANFKIVQITPEKGLFYEYPFDKNGFYEAESYKHLYQRAENASKNPALSKMRLRAKALKMKLELVKL